ncbi:MAG: DUF883 domain-containing protein [Burkholderiales bacterium]|nr:DUF883 domain-containing protein [Burkholderiales bacterium]
MNETENFQYPTSDMARRGNGSDTHSARMTAAMRESLSHARQKLEDTVATAHQRSRQMADTTSDYIQRWPFSAIAVAAGVGLLVGWLLATQIREEQRSAMRARSRWH